MPMIGMKNKILSQILNQLLVWTVIFFDFYDYYDGTLDGTRREKTMRPSIGEKKDKK